MAKSCEPSLKSVSLLWIDPDSWSLGITKACLAWLLFQVAGHGSQGRGKGALEVSALCGNGVLSSDMMLT